MSKICCVGDADVCPKSSSCSMVLRSACSHRHSRESSTVKEHLHSPSYRKSKHTSSVSKKGSYNDSLDLESALEQSLKQLALKSVEKTHSLLNGRFYESFEISNNTSQKVFESSTLNVSCSKELNFSRLSDSDSSSVYKNLILKECSSDYSSATASDINSSESLNPTSNMSQSQRLTRSSISSVRSLSASEDEDDIAVQSILRPRKSLSTNTNFRTRQGILSEEETNSSYLSNNNASHFGRFHNTNNNFSRYTGSSDGDSLVTRLADSSHMDRSSVQYSLFDRFRWFLWRWTYLKIIGFVNWDVWLLSRINNYGKVKAVFIMLIPLLFLLVCNVFNKNSCSREKVFEAFSSFIYSFLTFISSILSSVYGTFVQQEEGTISDKGSCFSDSPFYSSLSSLFAVASGWLSKNRESASSTVEMNSHTKEPLYHQREDVNSFQMNKEELRIVAAEVLKDEINVLKEYLKASLQETEADKLVKDQKLENEIKSLRLEFKSLSGTMGRLEKDILKQSERSENKENIIALTSEYKNHIDHLNAKLRTIEAKLGVLERLKNCCDKQWSEDDFLALLEKHLLLAFKNVIDSDTEPHAKYRFFNEWLNSKFFSHEKLMQEINAALKKQSPPNSENKMNFDNVIQVVESTVLRHVDSLKRNMSEFSRPTYSSFSHDIFSEDKVKKIVKEAIMLYDADKIGQVDYALESGGGSVLSTRCSETYVEKYGKLSIFGLPLWTNSNSPRTAIQPDVQPGRCWAFKGSQGFLVLELSATIYPTGFTLEHIPVSLSPSGSIDSAPKNFSVWGLDSEKDNKGFLLGEYEYDINGDPLQYFDVQKLSEKPYSHVELQIHSNHGNMEYTCLYRFRVHGQRVR